MITNYEIRVKRAWKPGIKNGQVITVTGMQRDRLVKLGMAEFIDKAKELEEVSETAPVKRKYTRRKKDAG